MWVRFITLAFVCNGLLMTANRMLSEFRQDGRISLYLFVFYGSALIGALLTAIREKVNLTGQELRSSSIPRPRWGALRASESCLSAGVSKEPSRDRGFPHSQRRKSHGGCPWSLWDIP